MYIIVTAITTLAYSCIHYVEKIKITLTKTMGTYWINNGDAYGQQWRIPSVLQRAHLCRHEIQPVNYIQLSINLYNTLR